MQTYAISYMIQRLQNFSLRNKSKDHFSNEDWVFKINQALEFMYLVINANGSWFFSNKSEVHITKNTSTGDTIWQLEDRPSNFFQVKGYKDETTTCPDILFHRNVNTKINDNPRNVESSQDFETCDKFYMGGESTIITEQNYYKIEIHFSRLPRRHDANALNEKMDCPDGLSAVVENLVFWLTYSFHFEQGANLSNHYYNKAVELLRFYGSGIGLTMENVGFITE